MYLLFKIALSALVLFLVLPVLIRRGVAFYPALMLASACTVIGYVVMSLSLHRFGVKV
jgi:hypothetical protein